MTSSLMTTPMLRPKVGILALTLRLYEELVPGLRQSREDWVRRHILPTFAADAEIEFPGAVFRTEDVADTVARFERSGVDAILVLLLTYAPSQIALSALARTRIPVVIWNTQELKSVDASFTSANMIDNHGVHGTQDLANVLLRAGAKFSYLTGHPDEPQPRAWLRDFFGAAAAVGRLSKARVGMIGYQFPGMGDLAVDTTQIAVSPGCSCIPLSVAEFIRLTDSLDRDAAGRVVEGYRRDYQVAPDVTEIDLTATASAELALRSIVREHQLDAFTYQFMAFGEDERSSTLPFVAASRLMSEGVGFAGEGDLMGALGTALFNWLQPPATFSEMFTIDFTGNAVFMSHMGEINVGMARRDSPVKLVARPAPITRTRNRQLALVASLEPGPATLCALTLGPAQRWRIITALVDILDFGPLPDFCVPHFKIRPACDVRKFLTGYAQAGGPHHNAIVFGDARSRLRLAAELIPADYQEVG